MKLQNGNKEHVELTLATYATTQLLVICTKPTKNEEKEPHFSANRIFAIFKSEANLSFGYWVIEMILNIF